METPRSLAGALAEELAEAGVGSMFGVPGGGPNLEKVGAAAGHGIDFVLAHGETAAAIMAATHGVLTGRPGVCIVTRGPGLTSAVNGAAQATLDRFPLLLVSDTVPAQQRARVAHQRLDQRGVMAPVTKWSGVLGHGRPRETVRAALELAVRAPAGSVHVDFDATAAGDGPPAVPAFPAPEAEAVEAARRMVKAARRPIFLIGAEAIGWTARVRATVRESGAPALSTYQAKGIVPDSWPNDSGLFTNGAIERPLVEQADLIVAVGLDPVEPIPAPWRFAAPVLAITPWAITDGYYEPELQVVGPVGDILDGLASAFQVDWEPDVGRRAKEAAQRAIELPGDIAGGGRSDGDLLTPHDVVASIIAGAPPGAVLTVDAGAHMLVAMPLLPAEEPRDVLISNGLATMGFAVPAAIGSALARPERPVVCLVGDGGLGMTAAELETIARLDLDVTVVVFNDSALSLIEIKQAAHHGGAQAVRYRPVDFAAVALGFGVPAYVATDGRELARAWSATGRGPRLIDARVDPTGYRHVIRATRG